MLKTIFYTNRFVKPGRAGATILFFIFICPEYKNDRPLLAHEIKHVEQLWRSWGIFPFLYLFSRPYRFEAEVEAYRTQLSLIPEYDRERCRKLFSEFIVKFYDLKVTVAEASAALVSDG